MQLASIHLALIGRMSVLVGWLVGRPVGSVQFNLKAIIDGRNPFQYKTMASNTHTHTLMGSTTWWEMMSTTRSTTSEWLGNVVATMEMTATAAAI